MNNVNYSLSLKMGQLLETHALKIAVAESCTGGGLANEITAVPGCSNYFECGFVTYTNEAKTELLDVPKSILASDGAVSASVAKAMAEGVIKRSHADIAISITGVAGPLGGTPEKPVGLVWFGLASRQGFSETRNGHFAGGRKQVRRLSIGLALEWVIQYVSETIVPNR